MHGGTRRQTAGHPEWAEATRRYAERLALARLCQMPCKKRYAAAVRFYREAFTAEPKLTDDRNGHTLQRRLRRRLRRLRSGHRRGQARRQGTRPPASASPGLAAGRSESLLAIDGEIARARPAPPSCRGCSTGSRTPISPVYAARKRWTSLPEAERRDWQQLWREVEDLRQRAQPVASSSSKKPTPAKESPTNKP